MARSKPETWVTHPTNIERPPVTLHDGRIVDSWSDEWRTECHARVIMSLPTLQQRREALEKIDRKQGPEYGAKLREIIRALWSA